MSTYNKYPRGSEWRKWDLHAHTPIDPEWIDRPSLNTSEKKKGFAKRYIEFAKMKDLSVIAITDHNFCNNLDDLLIPFIQKEAEKNLITVLPGFEVTASDGSGIHLLVIFPESTQLKKIDRITSHLFRPNQPRISYGGGIIGSNKSIDKIRKTLDESSEEYLMIFAHADRENGVLDRGTIRGQRRVEEWHKDFIKICQLAKSPNDYEEGFIHNVINNNDVNYRKDMTYIIASDCRCIEKNNKRDERFHLGEKAVWIKADPNIEGLKQIIYEPERVYYGDEPPRKTEKNKIIRCIKITSSNSWFQSIEIPFNEGQISIIGGKGTGKTAILDLIAYATKSFNIDDANSFLSRARDELIGTNIEVSWESGDKNIISIKKNLENALPLKKQKIKYLTQSFVEQLCDYENYEDLTKEIENIIFQNLPFSEKSEYLDFQSYKTDILKIITKQKVRNEGSISRINDEQYKKESIVKSESEIKKLKKKTEKDLKAIKLEYDSLKKKETKGQAKKFGDIEKLNNQKSKKETTVGVLNKKLLIREEIFDDIQSFKDESYVLVVNLKKKLKDLGLTTSTIDKVQIYLLPQDLEVLINKKSKQIEDKINRESKLIDELDKKIIKLTRDLKLEESRQDKLDEINKRISEYTKKKQNIDKEIKKIENYKKEIPQLKKQRVTVFKEMFYLLQKEYLALKNMYSPITTKLVDTASGESKLFDFYVKFEFDFDLMSEKGDELIDHTKTGKYFQKNKNALKDDLKNLAINNIFIDNDNKDEFMQVNKTKIDEFVEGIENLFLGNKNILIEDQLKKIKDVNHFYNWLFSFNYYKLNYSIKFNDTDLDKLSPGLKGIALLILFLELDKEDYTPLLVDQPEENLDNRSVYETLRNYFIAAKRRRQIFIVTHNPNLVVNTDSEQVLVANYDLSKTKQSTNVYYVSGSLEHNKKYNSNESVLLHQRGIKQHICHVLEGGERAFKERERKYAIQEITE